MKLIINHLCALLLTTTSILQAVRNPIVAVHGFVSSSQPFSSRKRIIVKSTSNSNFNITDLSKISIPTRENDGKSYSSPAAQFGEPLTPQITDFNKAAISTIKSSVFDTIFPQTSSHIANPTRTYARFYALETIARMPYFAYLSVLHLYETLGWFRKAEYLKLHFAESWNELHHLLIMEELGGNNEWKDRFVAQHTAFFYYWFVVGVYLFNPVLAYNLNQAVEEHAFQTYNDFLNENEEHLKQIDAPQVARDYYGSEDLYLFDHMQTNMFTCEDGRIELDQGRKTPIKCETLYDVFVAIRDDEMEHAKTMAFLQSQDSDIDLSVEAGEECVVDYNEGLMSA